MSFKYDDIRYKNSEELSEILTKHIEENGGNVSIGFLAEQIKREENKEFNIQMAKYTKWIASMTAIMLLATLVNVVIVFYGGQL